MKILSLKSENLKRLKVAELELDPNKDLVLVTGKNGQGKSSLLDSIFYALGGKKAVPGKPIREGEDHAEVSVNLAGVGSKGQDLSFTIKRTFTESDSYLTVTNNADGMKFSNPQDFLDTIVGALSFDPLAFTRMDGKKQVETLTRAVGLDFTPVDEEIKMKSDARLQFTHDIKALPDITDEQVATAKDVIKNNSGLPSVQEAMDKLREAEDTIREYEKVLQRAEQIKKQIIALQNELNGLALEKPEAAYGAREELKTTLTTLQDRTDAYKDAERLLLDAEKLIEKKKQRDKLTEDIAALKKGKEDTLSKTSMPIEGLSWDETGVTFNGIPFDQLSAAEQLKVSMAIAMATNPKLKIILVKDGSLLDPDNLAVIGEMAKESDMQVWVERVDDTGEIGIYIEDGTIKTNNL